MLVRCCVSSGQATRFITGLAALLLGGCALVQAPAERIASLAAEAGFEPLRLADTNMRAFMRRGDTARSAIATIYIESDGAPWRRPDEPPWDPTPHRFTVLAMASADVGSAVAYVGRPCQFLPEAELAGCDGGLWTGARFGETAIAATDRAVESAKAALGASRVNLVGYSGGGALAVLVASRRVDVACLVTVVAPLDTVAWTDAIGVSRLRESFNPVDVADRLSAVRQNHLAGARDTLVPSSTVARYLSRAPAAKFVEIDNFDHECCWEREWLKLKATTCLQP
jgi:hypothetical protein